MSKMLYKNYDRRYACEQIDLEVKTITQVYCGHTIHDWLKVAYAEVQILQGNDKVALELLSQCFGGANLIAKWVNAAAETQYDFKRR